MADKIIAPGPVQDDARAREAICVHTRQIYDSCQAKDCLEDLRVWLSEDGQTAVNQASSVKPVKADLLNVRVTVQPVHYNAGFYSVDLRYFYRVTADAFTGSTRPTCIEGFSVFDKRRMLFGSESAAKLFTSGAACCQLPLCGPGLPTAVVQAVDPIVLGMKLVDTSAATPAPVEVTEFPEELTECFRDTIVINTDVPKQLYVTLGQFSILRMERDAQLLIPVFDDCVPCKECACGGDDDPCSLFRQVQFPAEEFFPPAQASALDPLRDINRSGGCCGQ